MVMGFREIVNAIDKKYLVEELLEVDSKPELELTPDKLMELAAEAKEGKLYWEWLVKTGRVWKLDEELGGRLRRKKMGRIWGRIRKMKRIRRQRRKRR
jgi:hypothetical protein